METDDDEELDEDDSTDVVIYDETDSSRMIDEEVEALVLQKSRNLFIDQSDAESDHGDVHVVGAHMEKYTEHEFSSHKATNWWMEWDAVSHM